MSRRSQVTRANDEQTRTIEHDPTFLLKYWVSTRALQIDWRWCHCEPIGVMLLLKPSSQDNSSSRLPNLCVRNLRTTERQALLVSVQHCVSQPQTSLPVIQSLLSNPPRVRRFDDRSAADVVRSHAAIRAEPRVPRQAHGWVRCSVIEQVIFERSK